MFGGEIILKFHYIRLGGRYCSFALALVSRF